MGLVHAFGRWLSARSRIMPITVLAMLTTLVLGATDAVADVSHTFVNGSAPVAPYTSAAGTGTADSSSFDCPALHGSPPPPEVPASSWTSFLASEALTARPDFTDLLEANALTAAQTGWDQYLTATNGQPPSGFSSAAAAGDLLKNRLLEVLASQGFWAGIAQRVNQVSTPAGVDPIAFLGWMDEESSGVESTCGDPHQLGQRLWTSSSALFWQDGAQWAKVNLLDGASAPPPRALYMPVPNRPGAYVIFSQTTSYLPTVQVYGILQLQPYGGPNVEPRSCDPLEPSTRDLDGQIAATAYQVTRDVASWIPGVVVPQYLPDCDTVDATLTRVTGPVLDANGLQVSDYGRYIAGWTYNAGTGEYYHPAIARFELSADGTTYANPVVVGTGLPLDLGFNGNPVLSMSDDGSTIAMCNAGPGGISAAGAGPGGSVLYPLVVHLDSASYGWPRNGTNDLSRCGALSLDRTGSMLWWDQPDGWWSASTLLPDSAPAPTVTVIGVQSGANYEAGAAPTPGCAVNDTLDPDATASPSITGPAGPRSSAGLGLIVASCSYTDVLGRNITATATYTIVDTTAPVLAGVSSTTAEATSADGATVSYSVPGATDLVDGTDPVTCAPATGSEFPLGSTIVHCTATDIAGNTGQESFTVTVADTTPPTLAPAVDVTAEATSAAGAAVDYPIPAATDAVDGTDQVSCSPGSGATFPLGSTTVQCHATDAAGNTGREPFTVTVTDTTPPVLNLPDLVVADATSAAGAVVTWPTSAIDAVDGPVIPTCEPSLGATFGVGDTIVSCTASDTHGNTAAGWFTVHVRGAAEQLSRLVDEAASLPQPNASAAQLDAAERSLAAGLTSQAVNQLDAFLSRVAAESGKTYSIGQAAQLSDAAHRIIAVIGA